MNKEAFKRLLKIAGKALNKSKFVVFALILIFGLVGTSLYSGVTLAYAVEYNGDVIGQIRDKADYDTAVDIADDMVETVDFERYAHTPEFHVTLTVEKSLATPDAVAVSLIEKTKDILMGTDVYINGRLVACVDANNKVREFIDSYLSGYMEGEDIVSSFVAPVECVDNYYHKSAFTSFDALKEQLLVLDVQSVKTVRTEVKVPFETKKRRDDSLRMGVQKTQSEGIDGISNDVSNIIMLNGKEIKTEYVGREVVVEPVSKVVLVGNKGAAIKAAWIDELDLIWPLDRVKGQYVSSYWGDGRNHKGIDIASSFETEIYAAQGGKVITAEYSDGYGYYVVIEHNDEYKTLYGHASCLFVSEGDFVEQGELIAYVGSTGMSTGNHLHFEVIRKGKKIDAGPFIGL
ncbi:MAG: peptidoglycan DD-metalloendopeptidase family protein [Clostridia bacterium]|nr:peptidoglycan DD-metalloendopeptidase family protein [Clostridia bacterium]